MALITLESVVDRVSLGVGYWAVSVSRFWSDCKDSPDLITVLHGVKLSTRLQSALILRRYCKCQFRSKTAKQDRRKGSAVLA